MKSASTHFAEPDGKSVNTLFVIGGAVDRLDRLDSPWLCVAFSFVALLRIRKCHRRAYGSGGSNAAFRTIVQGIPLASAAS